MSLEIVAALVGIAGTLLGALLQSIISGLAEHQRRVREQAASWGPLLVELLNAGSGVERWVRKSDASVSAIELERQLDQAWNKILLLCPLEVTHSAHGYVLTANLLLKRKASLEALDAAEQDISLVYRRVAGINKSIRIRHRGKLARRNLAPEYR